MQYILSFDWEEMENFNNNLEIHCTEYPTLHMIWLFSLYEFESHVKTQQKVQIYIKNGDTYDIFCVCKYTVRKHRRPGKLVCYNEQCKVLMKNCMLFNNSLKHNSFTS